MALGLDKNGQYRGKWERPVVDPMLRFIRKFKEAEDGCWNWTGCVNLVTGYGVFNVAGRAVSAHSWVADNILGFPPRTNDGARVIDHICRNRRCVRPSHLRLVTQRENVHNGSAFLKTHCNYGHELIGNNLYIDGKGGRRCKECARLRDRTKYQLQKKEILCR